jgi:type III secretion protein J
MMRGRQFFTWCMTALLAVALTACGNKVELMASMPETDANEVLAALSGAGIGAHKISGKEGMVGLSVDATEVGRAVDLLRAKGLPRERFAGMGEVFKKEGLISSPLEERARYIYALSQELRGTLTQIDGVLAARVHVVLPERGSAGDPNTPSSAAVFIKHQEGYNLDTVQPQIRKLVTNSIPSLTADKVSIILISAQTPPPSTSTARPETTAGIPLGTVIGLLVLLLASLAASGFMAWKYWWPTRNKSGTKTKP